MSFLVSLIASIAIHGQSSAVLPMQKNDIIGYTVPARIGTPPQEVFLAVIFSADQTRVFPQDSCPAFVVCFLQGGSTTFRSLQTGQEDSFQLGAARYDRVEFHESQSLSLESGLLPNTAGFLGLSPKSAFGRRSIFMVSEAQIATSQEGPSLGLALEVLEDLPEVTSPGIEEVSIPLARVAKGWTVNARVELNNNDVFEREVPILFEPSRTEILIPLEWVGKLQETVELISEAFDIDEAGYLLLACTVNLKMQISVSQLKKVSIRVAIDLGSRAFNAKTSSFLCRTELAVSAAIDKICIGDTIFNRRHSLVFDGIGQRLIFRSFRNAAEPLILRSLLGPPLHQIPAFYNHQVVQQEGGLLRIEFRGELISPKTFNNGFILQSTRPALGSLEHSFAYVFLPAKGLPHDFTPSNIFLPGIYHLVEQTGTLEVVQSNTLSKVSLSLVEASDIERTAYEVVIDKTPERMIVALLPVQVAADPDQLEINLSLLRTEQEEGEESVCAVCLEQIHPGTSASVIARCKHSFHPGCINRWVSESKATCPLCAQSIPLIPGGRLRKAQL